ncbi:hypothetical protein VSVS05_04435 (plasmid) [Vibrio scophthalmi]|uniref:Uncharacterized protein n=1 Tax=Vibrio scophthalmi TaxID=45658 RepID=A0A1C7FHM7_9VIBR|nr:hypothetical protein VSVS05_04435 [Vibrio scophthalmi]
MVFWVKLEYIKEGEFKRMAQLKALDLILAQESSETRAKFHLVGVNIFEMRRYAVRHARINAPREWRLDHLSALVQSLGFKKFEVRFFEE